MSDEKKNKISRRQFLVSAGLVAGGAALAASCGKSVTETVTNTATKTATTTATTTVNATVTSPAVTVTSPAVTTTATPAPISFSVYEPTGAGASKISYLHAPRLDTLDGKTIALMACDATKWQTFRILPYIAALIQKKYPTAKFIPMTEFTMGLGVDSDADAQKAKDKGAQAMIDAYAA